MRPMDFFDLVLSTGSLIVMVASSAILEALKRMFPDIAKMSAVQRFLPLYPFALCEALIWIPGLRPAADVPPGKVAVLAIVLATFSGQIYSITKKAVSKRAELERKA